MPIENADPESTADPFVSRGGIKLQHALHEFALNVAGFTCADFGCSVGGFTDCLLRNGAAQVVAIDTAYGVLDYRLRMDPRVTVHERTNLLHCPPKLVPTGGIDLIVIDAGWTTQLRILPIALDWLRPSGKIISLIKPHYEWRNMPAEDAALITGPPEIERDQTTVLDDEFADRICRFVIQNIEARLPLVASAVSASPIRGGGKRRKKKAGPGNIEYLAFLAPRINT